MFSSLLLVKLFAYYQANIQQMYAKFELLSVSCNKNTPLTLNQILNEQLIRKRLIMLFNYFAHVPVTHMANWIYLVDTNRLVSGLVQLASFTTQTYYILLA